MNQKYVTLLPFTLEETHYALNVDCVQRVIPAAEITPLPKSPPIIRGIINLHGESVPVADTRKRLGLKPKKLSIHDIFIVAKTTSRRTIILIADSIQIAQQYPREMITAADQMIGTYDYIQGVVTLEDGLILIHDIDIFLSLEENKQLDDSLENLNRRGDE
ncbi:chemotaxis protein CheW [Chitinispirillum alkaliphilum]|nr:chemotaxis protein CheW [Chitinispirillum alkaliphilum]